MARLTRSARSVLDKNPVGGKENKSIPMKRTLRPRQVTSNKENRSVPQLVKKKTTAAEPVKSKKSTLVRNLVHGSPAEVENRPLRLTRRALALKPQCVIEVNELIKRGTVEVKSLRKRPVTVKNSTAAKNTGKENSGEATVSKIPIQITNPRKTPEKKSVISGKGKNVYTPLNEKFQENIDVYDFDSYNVDDVNDNKVKAPSSEKKKNKRSSNQKENKPDHLEKNTKRQSGKTKFQKSILSPNSSSVGSGQPDIEKQVKSEENETGKPQENIRRQSGKTKSQKSIPSPNNSSVDSGQPDAEKRVKNKENETGKTKLQKSILSPNNSSVDSAQPDAEEQVKNKENETGKPEENIRRKSGKTKSQKSIPSPNNSSVGSGQPDAEKQGKNKENETGNPQENIRKKSGKTKSQKSIPSPINSSVGSGQLNVEKQMKNKENEPGKPEKNIIRRSGKTKSQKSILSPNNSSVGSGQPDAEKQVKNKENETGKPEENIRRKSGKTKSQKSILSPSNSFVSSGQPDVEKLTTTKLNTTTSFIKHSVMEVFSTPKAVLDKHPPAKKLRHSAKILSFRKPEQFVTSTPQVKISKNKPAENTMYYSAIAAFDENDLLDNPETDNCFPGELETDSVAVRDAVIGNSLPGDSEEANITIGDPEIENSLPRNPDTDDRYALFADISEPQPRRLLYDDDDADIVPMKKPKLDYSGIKAAPKRSQKSKTAKASENDGNQEAFDKWASQLINHFNEIDSSDLLID